MEPIYQIFLVVLGLLVSCVVKFFHSFHQEKGKNRALMEDTARIEREKQQVIYDYNVENEKIKQIHVKEIEALKQQNVENLDKQKRAHEIDIQKRKYKYETKNREYYAFMNELDAFRGLNIDIIEKELGPMIAACFASGFGVSSPLFVQANDKAIKIIGDLRAQEAKLFSQVNGLKLSASEEILELLDELRKTTTQSKYYLEEVIGYIFSPQFHYTKSLPENIHSKAAGLNERTIDFNQKLLKALRSDLDQL
jgi:hypothetical protein